MTVLLAAVVLGLIPAAIARSKGRSFLGWWLYGSVLLIAALPHAILARRLGPGIGPDLPPGAFTGQALPASEEMLSAGLRVPLLIEYRDRMGELSSRAVVVHEAIGLRRVDGRVKIKRLNAYCYLRKAPRQFLRSGIVAAADPATGEIIEELDLYVLRGGR